MPNQELLESLYGSSSEPFKISFSIGFDVYDFRLRLSAHRSSSGTSTA
jgi:hypothetical protein